MSEARAPLRRIAIAGSGQVGVLAAIALKRALPMADVTVLGRAPDAAAFADHAPTALPFTMRLHERLGVSEKEIVRRAGGSHRLLTRYSGWSEEGRHGAFAYGVADDPALRTAFAREWGGGAARQGPGARPSGSLAEVLADAGRFRVAEPGAAGPLAQVEYALRWNPPAYRDLLIAHATRLGVAYLPQDVTGAEPDGQGGLAALAVAGGQRLEYDLIVDCTGPAARILAALPEFARRDWSAHLPTRQILIAPAGPATVALEDRFGLTAAGWRGQMAGRDGLRVTLGVPGDVAPDAAVRALGTAPQAVVPVAPGRVAQAWLGNVVAIGDAAASFEPLSQLNLDLAHRQIDLLLEMLPGRDIRPGERAEFNRRAALMADAVRDTLALHYAAPRAAATFGTPATPDAVAIALDQAARRGRVPFQEEAPFTGAERMALMAALGLPVGETPQSRALPAIEMDRARHAFAARAQDALAAAPPYGEWLAGVLSAS